MAGHVPNRTTKFEDRTPISSWFMSHNVSRLVTIENAYAATAHAPNHVIREQGVKNNYIFGIPEPDLLIHYALSVALRWM